jgi:hypothetical protein
MILENGYEIPEGYESMTCFHACGFIVIWKSGRHDGVGEKMDSHLEECPNKPRQSPFRTKGM